MQNISYIHWISLPVIICTVKSFNWCRKYRPKCQVLSSRNSAKRVSNTFRYKSICHKVDFYSKYSGPILFREHLRKNLYPYMKYKFQWTIINWMEFADKCRSADTNFHHIHQIMQNFGSGMIWPHCAFIECSEYVSLQSPVTQWNATVTLHLEFIHWSWEFGVMKMYILK